MQTIQYTCRRGNFSADGNDGDRICLIMLPMRVLGPVLTTMANTSSAGSSACDTCPPSHQAAAQVMTAMLHAWHLA